MINNTTYNVQYIEFMAILSLIEGGGVDPYYFSQDLQNVSDFVEDYKAKHNEFPTLDYIEQLCNFSAPEELLKDVFINEELKKLWLMRQIQQKLGTLVSSSAENPMKALDDITELCFDIRQELEIDTDDNCIKFSDIDKRIENYHDPEKRTIFNRRCSWGLDIIDQNTQGLCDGDLCFIVGATNQGKSWLSKAVAVHNVVNEGKKVILLPFEENAEESISRIDAIFGGVNSIKYMNKLLDRSEIQTLTEKMFKWKLSHGSKGELWIPDVRKIKRGSVKDIVKLFKSYDADLIIIDQLTLLAKTLQWDDVGKLVKDLKDVAMMLERPILCLTQAKNNYQKPIEESDLSCVALAEEISRNGDSVVYVGRHTDSDEVGTKFFKLMKTRRGSQLMTRNRWELDFSTIQELGEYVPTKKAKNATTPKTSQSQQPQGSQDFTTVWKANR